MMLWWLIGLWLASGAFVPLLWAHSMVAAYRREADTGKVVLAEQTDPAHRVAAE